METVATGSPGAKEDESSEPKSSCLMRVGRNSDWLLLPNNTEVLAANAN